MRHRKIISRIKRHLTNTNEYTENDLAEIVRILDHCHSTQHHDVKTSDINTKEKIKIFLAKALAELEVKEKDGTIIFYEKQPSWWQRNYPWVIGLISVIVAGLGAYVNWIKVVRQ
jgi:hypothetical protein